MGILSGRRKRAIGWRSRAGTSSRNICVDRLGTEGDAAI
jgi:hypothetical protein